MPTLLLLKTGSTFPELVSQKGDFEDWILQGMGLTRRDVSIVDVTQQEPFPAYDTLSGIVITGSHDMVTDGHAWNERTARWLRRAIEGRIPILGICYGHQLLAYACGGEVADNPHGREFGTVDIQLTTEAKDDLLFGNLSNPFPAHVCHTQSVLRLPPEARLLASSAMDAHQAIVIGECAWGVQFHPEFDVEATQAYIHACAQVLRAQGTEPEQLRQQCRATPQSSALLKRFYDIVRQKNIRRSDNFTLSD
ncbi:glutamine amidotransferase class-I [Candidatus Vecturithrix granuli]|uniref:Glutamine amidotransferase class-I n=1 Tax=Vecturithrix granuli TaxID=1499967 RepID=A0A081C285_VECG1|nr:glutamine amidotransferase class-I [Candidatus Vecturithrix granuli]